jgi:hypothetical protein
MDIGKIALEATKKNEGEVAIKSKKLQNNRFCGMLSFNCCDFYVPQKKRRYPKDRVFKKNNLG